jgi:hypothetical protein
MQAREALLRALNPSPAALAPHLSLHLWRFSELCLDLEGPALAFQTFDRLVRTRGCSRQQTPPNPRLDLLRARICWAAGSTDVVRRPRWTGGRTGFGSRGTRGGGGWQAIGIAKSAVESLKSGGEDDVLCAAAAGMTGQWLAGASTESREAVMNNWFGEGALRRADGGTSPATRAAIRLSALEVSPRSPGSGRAEVTRLGRRGTGIAARGCWGRRTG